MFYNVKPKYKFHSILPLTATNTFVCTKMHSSQCLTPVNDTYIYREQAVHECWLTNRFPVWNSYGSFPEAYVSHRGMSKQLGHPGSGRAMTCNESRVLTHRVWATHFLCGQGKENLCCNAKRFMSPRGELQFHFCYETTAKWVDTKNIVT